MISTGDGWISIKDALPPLAKEVLVAFEYRGSRFIGIGVLVIYNEAEDSDSEPYAPCLAMVVGHQCFRACIEISGPCKNNKEGDEIIAWRELPECPKDFY